MYGFDPLTINNDFDFSQLKSIKECEIFNKKPYVICCLFHFSQELIKKMKLLKIFLTKINKKDLKILCFVNNIKIKNIF